MSLMSDRAILMALSSKSLEIDPWDPTMLQPASVDMLLDREFLVTHNHVYAVVDPAEDQSDMVERIKVPLGECFVLHPGEFVLGSTYEQLTLNNKLAARIEGKSSLGRLGLLTHVTAGFVDPGFKGHLTLELRNISNLPIKLWPGMKIAQLCVFELSCPTLTPYGSEKLGSKYQGQRGPTASRSHQGFRRWGRS